MTKAQMLQTLADVEKEIESLRATFKEIKKKARSTGEKAVSKNDLRHVQDIRKKLGLV